MSGYLVEPIRNHEDFITLKKGVSILICPLKILLLAILAVFDFPGGSFEVLNVSDLLHKIPWHARSPEHFESPHTLEDVNQDCHLL